jgi:16S rRNA (guanine(966)-N(2))-methyltransferase RsmD
MAGIRVISGTAKGKKLRMVTGVETRPIGDRVKESLFNIIGADIKSASFLDLFAGTGSVGIEALSRKAEKVLFIDSSKMAIDTIHANLKHTKLEESAKVVQGDAFRYISGEPKERFDYVYIAPPQYQELWKQAILAIDNKTTLMNIDGWIIVQIHPREYERLDLNRLEEFDQRKYGNTLLVFYEFPGD